jgi:hypothetical protein
MVTIPSFEIDVDFDIVAHHVFGKRHDDAIAFIGLVKSIDPNHWGRLAKAVCDFSIGNRPHRTSLLCICASNPGSSQIMRLLLEAGANPNMRCMNGNHPLSEVIDSSSRFGVNGADELECLLRHGADPNHSGLAGAGMTVLAHAVFRNRIDLIPLLLKFGADPALDLIGDGSALSEAGRNVLLLDLFDKHSRSKT